MNFKLRNLLLLMEKEGLDVLLLQHVDEYQSGCVQENRQRVRWLSGFAGSSALLIICRKGNSGFFTDSRYTIQAALEVDEDDYEIHDFCEIDPSAWIEKSVASNSVIGYEGELFTPIQIKRYMRFNLRLVPYIMVDKLWDRPMGIRQRVIEHPVEFTGSESSEKRALIAGKFSSGTAILMTDVDAISWLLNIRNLAFVHSPSVLSRAVLRHDGQVELFIDGLSQVEIRDTHVKVHELHRLPEVLSTLGEIVVDMSTIPMSIFALIRNQISITQDKDPCTLPRAVKNAVEVQGMVKAHVRDGVAMVNFLYWLYHELAHNKKITEIDAALKAREFREAQQLFLGESFDAISGFGGNGAIVHYRANNDTNRLLEKDGIYLLDSGGQYLDGTTDITRTIAIGCPTAEQIRNFTLVLKGHIALGGIIFPVGTSGGELDVLARQYLWREGFDYGHGTGHGVGSFLSVHEGPQAISRRNCVELLPGMVLSNEPGFYKYGEYGIRIENLMYVEDHCEGFRRFKQLTCVPIDLNLVDVEMLNSEEVKYVNSYHSFVYEVVSPHISVEVREWLKTACRPV